MAYIADTEENIFLWMERNGIEEPEWWDAYKASMKLKFDKLLKHVFIAGFIVGSVLIIIIWFFWSR